MAESLTMDKALAWWRRVVVEGVAGEQPDLTMRQLAVALSVYTTAPPHTVRGLAARLNVSKPAITRTLDRLSQFGLVRRKRDDADRRNILVQRTVKGSVYLAELAERIARAQPA